MRAIVLWALILALASPVAAADPPAAALSLKVKVALALNACQCDKAGEKCADPPTELAARVAACLTDCLVGPAVVRGPAPTDAQRYAAVLGQAAGISPGGGYGLMAVGIPCPAEPAAFREAFPRGFLGLADGVYECYGVAGVATFRKRNPPAVVAAPDWRPALLPGFGELGPVRRFPENCAGTA